jgi:hypothetical protein
VLRTRLSELGRTTVDVSATGVYPETKRRTKVQDVAFYQNDGTATITASHFVERAESRANGWALFIRRDVIGYIDGNPASLNRLGEQIARDINNMVDRIDTRRLKHSMRHVIKKI